MQTDDNSQPANQSEIFPYSSIAERAVIGSCFLSPDGVDLARRIISATDFLHVPNRILFDTLIDLRETKQSCDPVVVRQTLTRKGLLEEIGGAEYLAKCMIGTPSAANVEYYAEIVKDNSLLRQLACAVNDVREDIFGKGKEAKEILDNAEQKIFDICSQKIQKKEMTMIETMAEMLERVDAGNNPFIGLQTGFFELDGILSGLHGGELIIIAGRTSMGKTSLGLNIAEYMAFNQNVPIGFFSLEMNPETIGTRIMCSQAKVDSHRFRSGYCDKEEKGRLRVAYEALKASSIFVQEIYVSSIYDLKSSARLMVSRNKIQALFVDYLQLIHYPRAESRQLEISMVSDELKALAVDLNIPVICMAQLNRAAEGREDHRPRMSDLRESGAIENSADVILLLYRDGYYHPETNNGATQVIVAKQRNGPVGTVNLLFMEKYTRFENLAASLQMTQEQEEWWNR